MPERDDADFGGTIARSRRVLYVQFTDPAAYPPLEHSSRLLAERGWQIVFLGTGTVGHHNLQFPPHPRIEVRALGFVQSGWKQKLHYAAFLVWTFYWAWQWKPGWIYASDPLACPVVWVVKKLLGVHVVYHEHDSPAMGEAQSWFMRKVLAFRGRVGREAELCVLPQQARMQRFLEDTKRTGAAFCVWNCPRRDEIQEEIQKPDANHSDRLVVYYHGSIASVRVPKALIIAASRLKDRVRVRVAGYEAPGSTGYVQRLVRLAQEKGVAIEYFGTMPRRRDLLRVASRSDLGLSFMPKISNDVNLTNMVGASNKPFDYMACGLPLLVTDLPEWVSTFVESGYARACDPEDPDSIEAALLWYLDHPQERREMGRRGRDKIQRDWNYETVFAGVRAEMEHV